MSKPVTNVEIEDVLSSIRRLVSSSDRVERRDASTEEETPDKLVLTPSQRVDEEQEDAAANSERSIDSQQVTDDLESGDSADQDETLQNAEDQAELDEEASDDAFLELMAGPALIGSDQDSPIRSTYQIS